MSTKEHKTEIITASWDGEELSFSSKFLNDEERNEHVSRKRLKAAKHDSALEMELMSKFCTETEYIFANNIAKMDLKKSVSLLVGEHLLAYQNANNHLRGVISNPLFMLIHGNEQFDRSQLTKTICKSNFLEVGRLENKFPSLALDCQHKDGVFKLFANQSGSDANITLLQRKLSTCVLFVLKNVEYLCLEDLYQISCRMSLVFGNPHLAFGGIHTILEGNLMQVTAANGTRLNETNIPETNLKARAGHSILIEQMNYFVNLSVRNQSRQRHTHDGPVKQSQVEDEFSETEAAVNLSLPFHSKNSSGFVSFLNL
jgi:hypothetical protein